MATAVQQHQHRSHEHPLRLINPAIVYPEYDGQWKCDNCNTNYQSTSQPYHCTTCPYDLCESCFETKRHLRHEHPLYFIKMQNIYPQYNGEWKCDGCGNAKGPPSEPNAYHCFYDQFDLCSDCFNGHQTQIHSHPLIPADTGIVYNNSPGLWICDICRKTGTELGTQFSWHCSECEFDCCNECLEEIMLPPHIHEHPLKITDSFIVYPSFDGGWKCDICRLDKNPSMQEPNVSKPYHCRECQFDACHNCINQVLGRTPQEPHRPGARPVRAHDVAGPPSHLMYQRRNIASTPVPPVHLHEPPVEMYDLETEDEVNIENLDDSQKCIVCLSRPKNATIVHQHTGHVCCCLRCAYTLQQRGDKCPICRADIDKVIRHYNS